MPYSDCYMVGGPAKIYYYQVLSNCGDLLDACLQFVFYSWHASTLGTKYMSTSVFWGLMGLHLEESQNNSIASPKP